MMIRSLFIGIAAMLLIACNDAPVTDDAAENTAAGTQSGLSLPDAPADVHPPLTGTPAPSFTVRRVDGSAYHFDQDALERPVILVFYRGGWCPYCSAQLAELRTIEGELRGLGYELLFLSADSPQTLREGEPDPDAGYTLLADNDLEAARAYGIAFRLDDETFQQYLEYGLDLEQASGRDHHGLPVPSVFIVTTDGKIAFQYVNPDYTMRIPPSVLVAAAEASLDDRDVRERQ